MHPASLAYCAADFPPPDHFNPLPVVFSDLVPAAFRERKNRTEFPMQLDSLETFLRVHGYTACDYAFLPAEGEPEAGPLHTLGVRGQAPRPVRAARLWGINMMNYLQAPALFTLLRLAGVPALRRERGEGHPLVVLGGHIWANPLPLTDFYDVLVVGDGEEVLLRIAELLSGAPHAGRAELLAQIAALAGTYVPGFTRRPVRVARINFADPAYPAGSSIILDGSAALVLARGCPNACAFCSSSVVGGAYRIKPADQLRAHIARLRQAGADTVIPIAASAGAYQSGGQTLLDVLDALLEQGLAIKYMSDRPERFSPRYLRLLAQGSGKTILAVESSPQVRRQVFQKTLQEATVTRAIAASVAAGIPRVQFYAILALPPIRPGLIDHLPQGHPGEGPADLRYLAQLAAHTARQLARAGLQGPPGKPAVQLDCMPFIPAIGTRLQKAPFSSYAIYEARLAELGELIRAQGVDGVEVHPALDEPTHLLQAFLERAGPSAGLALYRAWQAAGQPAGALPLAAAIRQAVQACGAEAGLLDDFLEKRLPYEGLIEVENGGSCGAAPG